MASAGRHCKNCFTLGKFLWKNRIFLSNRPQYFFFYLVTRHCHPFSTIIHFPLISYPTSTKLSSKISMVEFFLKWISDLSGKFGCWIERLFCRETVGACFYRKELHKRRVSRVLKRKELHKKRVSGVLKRRIVEGCSLQAWSLLQRNSNRGHFL